MPQAGQAATARVYDAEPISPTDAEPFSEERPPIAEADRIVVHANLSRPLPQKVGKHPTRGQSPFFLGAPLTHPWRCFTAANASETCTNSKFINGIDAKGDIVCAAPPGTPPPSEPEVWVDRQIASQDTPVDLTTDVATLSLPAGTFLIQATGTAQDDNNGSDQVAMYCQLDGQGAGNRDVVIVSSGADGINASGTIAVEDVVSFNAPTDEHLNCLDLDGSDHVRGIVMTATELGAVH